ncbi:MAG: hypothetical protein OCC49_13375 [Fibrobacterales bacterium]
MNKANNNISAGHRGIIQIIGIFMCSLLFAQGAFAQDDIPFTFIRVGDMDGFGFKEGHTNQSAAGSQLNVDGIGMLYGGDFLPDLNYGGTVQAAQGDDFDNRDGEEHGNSKVSSRGAIIKGGTKGSSWTDHTMAWGTKPEFVFDFSVKEGLIDTKAELYFNMIFGDYDNHGATIDIFNNNGLITTLTPTLQNKVKAGEENDGLIQTTYYTIKFKDVFHSTNNGHHEGYFRAVFNNVSDPLLAFDFAELGADPIRPDIILAPGPAEMETKDDTITAGEAINLIALVSDIYYKSYPTKPSDFKWSIIEDTKAAGDTVIVSSKGKSSFTATRAHRTVDIKVVYTDPDNSKTKLRDTVSVTIVPADPYAIDVEPTKKRASKQDSFEDISLTFDDESGEDTLFAFVRDEYGNFIESSKNATWSIGDADIVSVSAYGTSVHGRVLDKGDIGSTIVTVSEGTLNSDSVTIVVDGFVPEPEIEEPEIPIVKSISTLELEMEEDDGVVGTNGDAEITITAEDFESTNRTLDISLRFPNGDSHEVELERTDDDGVYALSEDIYDELVQYAGDRITIEASFVDGYGDVITAEIKVEVYEKEPVKVSAGTFEFGVARSLFSVPEADDNAVDHIEAFSESHTLHTNQHALFVAHSKGNASLYNSEEETFESTNITDAADFVGPTITIELTLPKVKGDFVGSDGEAIDGEAIGAPQWSALIYFQIYYYSTTGQFVRELTQELTVPQEQFSDKGTATLYIEWLPELDGENPILTASNGRQLQSGVILSVINSSVIFKEETKYVDLNEEDTQEKQQSMMHNLGYLRAR